MQQMSLSDGKILGRVIKFTLPKAYALPNSYNGQHKFALARRRWILQREVANAASHLVPKEPFKFARVELERWSIGTPDYDNLATGGKAIVDCLTTPVLLTRRTPGAKQCIRNKAGLGFIVDDNPDCAELLYKSVKCKLCEQKTIVTITELLKGTC